MFTSKIHEWMVDGSFNTLYSLSTFEGFLHWGYPQLDEWFISGFHPNQTWMMTGGSPSIMDPRGSEIGSDGRSLLRRLRQNGAESKSRPNRSTFQSET